MQSGVQDHCSASNEQIRLIHCNQQVRRQRLISLKLTLEFYAKGNRYYIISFTIRCLIHVCLLIYEYQLQTMLCYNKKREGELKFTALRLLGQEFGLFYHGQCQHQVLILGRGYFLAVGVGIVIPGLLKVQFTVGAQQSQRVDEGILDPVVFILCGHGCWWLVFGRPGVFYLANCFVCLVLIKMCYRKIIFNQVADISFR